MASVRTVLKCYTRWELLFVSLQHTGNIYILCRKLRFIFLQTGRWNDVSCTELNTYICKMPKAHYPLPSVKPTMYGCSQVGPSFPVVSVVLCSLKQQCVYLEDVLFLHVRVGTRTATPATGWKRRSGVGPTLKPSVRSRTPSCCTSETCEDESVGFQTAEIWMYNAIFIRAEIFAMQTYS